MMKKLLAVLIASLFGSTKRVVHAKVRDAADQFGMTPYRMSAGFPGDVNRIHPFSVEADLISAARPPTAYGQFVTIDTVAADNSVRPFAAADTALTHARGVTVRPYPTQQTTGGATASFGAATPPVTGVIDVLTMGYIMVRLNDIAAAPKKGDPVFVWAAATSGIHTQGGIEVVASGGNTLALDVYRYQFNGPPDASGNVEISVNILG